MFVVMASGKCEPHTYIPFLKRILNSIHMKKFNIFFHNICAKSNIHFSGLDNVKMTCQTHKFTSKLLLGKDMFTLKFVDLENETSISIWVSEKMKVKIIFLPSFKFVARLNSRNRNETFY